MKTLLIAVSLLILSIPATAGGERIYHPDGSKSRYVINQLGPKLSIIAEQTSGKGRKYTASMTDFDGDGSVDLAYEMARSMDDTDDDRRYFHRVAEEGEKFMLQWQIEFNEAKKDIHRITGRRL